MLTELDTDAKLMLIPCDTAGNFSWSGATRAPLQRTAAQMSSTSNQYSDLERPWISIPQEDWTGGRGLAIHTKDVTRYGDGKRAQAAFNEVIYNGPLDHYSIGFRNAVTNCPGSLSWRKLVGYMAIAFSTSTAFDAGEIYLHIRRRGTPAYNLVVDLMDVLGNAGTVLATHTFTKDEITDTLAEFRKFTFTDVSLSTGRNYFIRVHCDGGTEQDHWEIGINKKVSGHTQISPSVSGYRMADFDLYYRVAEKQTGYVTKFFTYEQLPFMIRQKIGGTPTLWLNGDIGKVTSVTDTTITDSSKSWATNAFAGARVGIVYQHGAEEHADTWRTIKSNTSTTLTIDKAWDINPDENSIFIINDTPLWHSITGHGLTSYITDVHVINGVVYFCQGDYVNVRKMRWNNGTFEWIELDGIKASFLQSVRDSSGMMLWRGRNDDENHKRSVDRSLLLDWETPVAETPAEGTEKELFCTTLANITTAVTTSGGTVVTSSVDFGSGDYDSKQYVIDITTFTQTKNAGSCVITLQEAEDNAAWENVQSVTAYNTGRWYITAHCQYRYRRLSVTAKGDSTSVNNIVVKTTQKPHFVDRVHLQDNYGKITRLFEYGAEQYKDLWVIQEGMLASINKVAGTSVDTYTLDRINLDELQTTAEQWNGKAMATSDVYLLWGWLNGLQRYYNTQLEGKGPDHDEGLPFERQGRTAAVLSYPSNFFIGIDAEDGYSAVMQFNQEGWHEIYRAPNPGERLTDMAFQPIYGTRPDKMWISIGDDVIWLSMPSKILYAIQDRFAEYTHEGVLISSWHTAGMVDIEKLWHTLKIIADYLDGENCWIEADYQVDEENIWHPIKNWYTESPSQKEELNELKSVNGKKLRYRLRMQTTDMNKTPKVNAVVLEAVGRVDIKMSYNFYFRNIKYKRDLTAEFEDLEPVEMQEVLDEWANGLKKLRLNSRWKMFDDKIVYLDAAQTSILTELQEGYIGQITLNEV
ncbi:MAG: hypothetical protein IKS81_04715 [Verrucomicrobia bacterium]|nr:hypothetical protein [Verrucomicrobiota bacterium]